jgi:hypothetical protein
LYKAMIASIAQMYTDSGSRKKKVIVTKSKITIRPLQN